MSEEIKMQSKLNLLWLAIACGCAGIANAQLQLLPDKEPQCVFAAGAQKISLVWQNAGEKSVDAEIRAQLFQAGSATAMSLGGKFWKQIEILPGQTVLETASVDFPAVNAQTKFLIQWLAGTNRVLGKTEVFVYPTNLLGELKPLLGEENVGVLDPNGELKPVLKQNRVEFLDLGEMALEDFSGKLAIIGPFQTRAQMREGMAQTIQRIARKGTAVIWIQPPPKPTEEIKPSYFVVPEGKGVVVVVQPDLVADFSRNPISQLNLIHFCKLALNPSPPALPGRSPP
jgi:hypothetical protein